LVCLIFNILCSLQGKVYLYIRRKEIGSRPWAQFPHSCVCARFI
jgi:hypothetical protein